MFRNEINPIEMCAEFFECISFSISSLELYLCIRHEVSTLYVIEFSDQSQPVLAVENSFKIGSLIHKRTA